MKTFYLKICWIILIMTVSVNYAQVGIGTTTPEAQFDVRATNQATPASTDGMLIPKVDAFPAINPNLAQQSMLVYLTTATVFLSTTRQPGFYYWNNPSSDWIGISSSANGDHDWYEEGTTTAPDAITDNMFHTGNVAIGRSTANYPLDVETTTSAKGISNLMNNSTNGAEKLGIENTVTGSSDDTQYGIRTTVSNSGSGFHYGNRVNMTGTGSGLHIGNFNDFNNTGTGNLWAVYNRINNATNNFHYGVFNDITGADAENVGMRTLITGTNSALDKGVENLLNGSGNAIQIGTYNTIGNQGSGIHYGTYNDIANIGTGTQYGTYNTMTATGAGAHYGTYNTLIGNGVSALTQYGTSNNISKTGTATHIGTENTLSGFGNGTKYGELTTLSGSGTGTQFGNFINITNSGNNDHYGLQNTLSGAGSGIHYGTHTTLGGNGNGNQYGSYTAISNSGTGIHYGSYNALSGNGFNGHTGVYNLLSGGSGGVQTGIYNEISNTAGSSHYGAYSSLTGTGAATKYGFYALVNSVAGGTHYGVYSEVLKAGATNFAGYFLGNVGIGTTTANTYTMPASRGANLQIMQTNGAGVVTWQNPSVLQDHDWYEVGTTTAPDAITDNMFHTGNVAIGKNTALYALDITSAGRTISSVSTSATNAAVYAVNSTVAGAGAGGHGVFGQTSQTGSSGVRGEQLGTAGTGLLGVNFGAAGAGSGSGIYGQTGQSQGFGLNCYNTNASGTGSINTGNNVVANYLVAGSGGAFNGFTTGIMARSTTAGISTAVYSENFGTPNRVNYWDGTTMYKIIGTGTVSTTAEAPNGDRVVLHCTEAPEIYFEDYGQGQLTNGRVHIEIDPIIAKNITVNERHPLRVFIQLEDECNGVFVTNKTGTSFDVVELASGNSNAKFQYRIVANRADEVLPGGRLSKNADVRFEKAPGLEATKTAAANLEYNAAK